MGDDPVMRETMSVIKAYVTHRLAPDMQRSFNRAAEILICLGDEVLSKHRETFGEVAEWLDPICDISKNANFVSTMATHTAREVFSPPPPPPPPPPVLIALLTMTAQEVEKRHRAIRFRFTTVDQRVDMFSCELSRVMVMRHGPWIRGRGGWDDFVRRFEGRFRVKEDLVRSSKPTCPCFLMSQMFCAVVVFGILPFIAGFITYLSVHMDPDEL
uniref:Uncharacterized protein n=1 Tax=Eptatretus burgeri TaxID=7764 RepID=A0A8C4PWD0_EPTBU